MEQHFTAEFFKNNRLRLRQLFKGTAPIVITANGLLQRSGDSTFPFRQDSNFWYLTGISEPDVVLVMDKGKEYLIVPEREQKRAVFDGQIDANKLSEISAITDILDASEGKKRLSSRISRVKHVATLAALPAYVKNHGFYANPARESLIKEIKSINNKIELLDLNLHLARLRQVKQEPELKAIRMSIGITAKALKQVKKRLGSYQFEYQIEADILHGFGKVGAKPAYQPIVASGHNACNLHYVANSDSLVKNRPILIDVGASVSHYAADISRTFFLGKPSRQQKQVFIAVTRVQDFAFSLLRPGVILREYEHQTRQFMGEQLRQLGLIRTINKQNIDRYFPHSISHFLGLDVHDAGDYALPLEAGMVLTVEPGIYIPEEGFGVRIEDDVLITDTTIENLSRKLPREL